MWKIVSGIEMKGIEKVAIEERSIKSLELMERAGRSVARVVQEIYKPALALVMIGKGNNGGDGLVTARVLAEQGVRTKAVFLLEKESLRGENLENYARLPSSVEQVGFDEIWESGKEMGNVDVVIDAILGTGTKGPARGILDRAIRAINESQRPVVSIDIPSGLDADTGQAEGSCIYAAQTVTMGLPKVGLLIRDGIRVAGDVYIADIGFPEDLMKDEKAKRNMIEIGDMKSCLLTRPRHGHKGTFGSLLVVAGSHGMEGAAYLTAGTALRTGVGLVYAAFPQTVTDSLAGRLIEAVKVPIATGKGGYLTQDAWEAIEPYLARATAIALGPGIGTREETGRLVDELVCQDVPLVVDADGLNCLGGKALYLTARKAETILTPHPGEMGRLLGIGTKEVEADRFESARRLAREAKAIVVLKGAQTVTAHPDGRTFLNPINNTGLAKGGSGDVLTGLIAGLLAQGCPALEAAYCGAYLHGMAGNLARREIGVRGMTAGDVLERIPAAIRMAEECAGVRERETQILTVSCR